MRTTLKAIMVGVVIASLVGGTAVGASKLITGKQIKNSSITGVDVKNKSLSGADFRGSVRGPMGATGATGATGAEGPSGPPGLSQVTTVNSPLGLVDTGEVTVTARCPDGMTVIGTGFGAGQTQVVNVSSSGTSVSGVFRGTGIRGPGVGVQAICAVVNGPVGGVSVTQP